MNTSAASFSHTLDIPAVIGHSENKIVIHIENEFEPGVLQSTIQQFSPARIQNKTTESKHSQRPLLLAFGVLVKIHVF